MFRSMLGGLLAGAFLAVSPAANAQLFRTYLSLTGNDANSCALTAPCRLLPAALAAVADGGEIWMLDTANYNTGQVNIAKSVTILAAPGVVGSVVITAAEAAAIHVAGAGVRVGLRNLVVVPLPGVAGTGVRMTEGGHLAIEGTSFVKTTIGVEVRALARVAVIDSSFRGGTYGVLLEDGAIAAISRSSFMDFVGAGVFVSASAAGEITRADIGSSTFQGGPYGVYVTNGGGTANATVSGCLISRAGTGLAALGGSTGASRLSAFGNTISQNTTGILTSGSSAKVMASGNLLSLNANAFHVSGGPIESWGNNTLQDNITDVNGGALVPRTLQ